LVFNYQDLKFSQGEKNRQMQKKNFLLKAEKEDVFPKKKNIYEKDSIE